MKTAIIKTDFWKQDRIFELLPDARYFYICLLTNPDRNGTQALKCSDRLMSAYTGYNSETIQLCKKELIKKDFIKVIDGYYIFNNQDYIQPTKGKLTAKLYEKDFSILPRTVQESLMSGSGTVHECIGIGNSISICTSNSKGNTDINDIFSLWEEIVGYQIESNKQKNRYACSNLLKKHGKDKLSALMRGVAVSQSDQFAPRISDFVSLQSKVNELIAWGKRQSSGSTKKVVKV